MVQFLNTFSSTSPGLDSCLYQCEENWERPSFFLTKKMTVEILHRDKTHKYDHLNIFPWSEKQELLINSVFIQQSIHLGIWGWEYVTLKTSSLLLRSSLTTDQRIRTSHQPVRTPSDCILILTMTDSAPDRPLPKM